MNNKLNRLRHIVAAALALLVNQATAADVTLNSSASAGGTITVTSPDTYTIAVGSSATRTLTNAITLGGGTLKGGIMDNVATVSGLSGAGTNSTFVDANGVTIILKGSGTTNTTANLTLAGGVNVTGANQLLVGGGAGGGGGRSTRTDGGGGGGGFVVLTTGNLSGTLALTAGGGSAGAASSSGATASGGTSSIGATTASGGGGAASSSGTPNGKGGDSSQTISGTTTAFTGGFGFSATNANAGGGGGAGSSANGATGLTGLVGGAGGAGTVITTGVVGLSTYLGSNTFGGGGGGGADTTRGAGGAGGGGQGAQGGAGGAGTDGLGGGGGGGANGTTGTGGAGGAGSLAIQYAYNSNVAAGTLTLSGGITLNSTATLDAVRSGGLIDITTTAITGAGGVTIASSASSGGVVRLSAANTYNGATTISAGTLTLGVSGSISNTPLISIAAGATLNVSAITTFNLSSSTSLSASGTASSATLNGNASANSVNLGSRPITLTYDGVNPALTISQGQLVLNANAFTVNRASVLADGDYTIVSATSGSNIVATGLFTVNGTALTGKVGAISAVNSNVVLTVTSPAGKLAVTVVPGSATAGTSFSVTVEAQDSGGTPIAVTANTGISLTASGAGTLSGNTATITAGQTNITLTTVQYTKAETITLTAARTSGDLLDTSVASSSFAVAAGAASQLVFSTQPSANNTNSVPFATQPVVQIKDALGNVVTSGADATATVALTLTTGTGTLGGTPSMAAVAGKANFAGKGLNINAPGVNKVLTATATLSGPGAVTTTTSPAFTVIRDPATLPLRWAASGSGDWDLSTANWKDTNAATTTFQNGEGVRFDETYITAHTTVTLNTAVTPASVTVSNATYDYTISGSGNITGAIPLTKAGTGTLTLTGSNTFTGGVTISPNGGTVIAGHNNALGSGTATLAGNNSQLTLVNGITVSNLLSLPSSGGVAASRVILLPTGATSATYAGNINIINASANNVLVLSATDTGSSLVISGIISGNGGFNTSGSGTIVLTNANSYSLGTIVGTGSTLSLGNGGITGRLTATTGITNAGNLTINRSDAFSQATDLGAGVAITGAGSFTQAGAGTTTLTATNTYSGKTTINAGTLALSGGCRITNTASIVVASNAVFDVSGLSSAFTLAQALSTQTLSNSAPGAIINGTNNCSAGTISLVYDGVNPAFTITNGTMTLSASTAFKVNNTGAQLAAGTSYKLIAKAASGTVGLVAGAVTASPITVDGNGAAATATLSITGGELWLNVAGGALSPSTISYSATGPFTYNGSAQTPAINISGSTGVRTTNYVGVTPTSYGPSAAAPKNAGTYALTNTVLSDLSYSGATNGLTFTIAKTNLTITAQPNTKDYNGTTASATNAQITAGSIQGGDTAPVWTQTYDNANAGTGKTLTPSSLVVTDGNGGTNYNYTYTATNAGVINVAPVTFSLFSSAQTNGYRDSVTFLATNLPAGATSNVVFQANGMTFSTNGLVSGGAISLAITNLPRGATNLITATYSGDSNYLSASVTLTQTVTNHPPVVTNQLVVARSLKMTWKTNLSYLATNWTDADGDALTLTTPAENQVYTSTNGVAVTNNGVFIFYLYTTNSADVNDRFYYTISDGFGGTNTGYVDVIVNPFVLTGQSLGLTNPATPTLTYYGIQGFSYSVERSTNVTFSPVSVLWQTNLIQSGPFSYTDTNPPQPQAFYRLTSP